MAIGLPSHFYPFPRLQFGCAYALANEHATLALRTLLQCHQIGIPIRIIEELRKRIERREARYTIALDISPNTFDSRERQYAVLFVPNLLNKMLEISRGLQSNPHALFYVSTKRLYLG